MQQDALELTTVFGGRIMKADQRKQEILDAAMSLAAEHGYRHIQRDLIADRAGCAAGLVNRYYHTMPLLRRALMGEAIRTGNLIIIAQGLVDGDPRARGLDEETKQEAMQYALTFTRE